MQIFWVPQGLPPTPQPSRSIQTSVRQAHLSKSQSSLFMLKKAEEKKLTKTTNELDLRNFGSNNQVTKLTESPSYADYENYFYI